MTTYAWPTSRVFVPRTVALRQIHNNRVHESPQSGYTQTNSTPGARWGWAIDFGPHSEGDRATLEAFLTRLSGREHRVSLHDIKRSRPRGDINLSGVTLGASAAQFATSITLGGCGAGKTLLAGDWLGLPGGQLVMAAAAATANGSGVMVVEIRHPLRSALSSGGAIVLDKPTALYILAASTLDLPRQPGMAQPPLSIELIEVFA